MIVVVLSALVCFAWANFHEDTLDAGLPGLPPPPPASASAGQIQGIDGAEFERMAGTSMYHLHRLCRMIKGCNPVRMSTYNYAPNP